MRKNRDIAKRNKLHFALAKAYGWPAVKMTSLKEYEIPDETLALMREQHKHKQSSIFFAGPHKSMYETIALPYTITWHGGDIPFAIMGDNLLKKVEREDGEGLPHYLKNLIIKKGMKYVLEHSGAIMLNRNGGREELLKLVNNTTELLVKGRNVMGFPEGTRAQDGLMKNFNAALFQGVLRARAQGREVDIIPVNVDYSCLPSIDLEHFLKEKKESYVFHVKDNKKWRRTPIEEVYISFGKPLHVTPDDNKKDLAYRTREACLDLVKIQPVNITSAAIMQLQPQQNEDLQGQALYDSIEDVLVRLDQHHDKYRGFSARRSPVEIVEKSLLDLDIDLMSVYNIYTNYIAHYLE